MQEQNVMDYQKIYEYISMKGKPLLAWFTASIGVLFLVPFNDLGPLQALMVHSAGILRSPIRSNILGDQ